MAAETTPSLSEELELALDRLAQRKERAFGAMTTDERKKYVNKQRVLAYGLHERFSFVAIIEVINQCAMVYSLRADDVENAFSHVL